MSTWKIANIYNFFIIFLAIIYFYFKISSRLLTVCSTHCPSSSIVTSAYFSYNGTLSLYKSVNVWPSFKTTPLTSKSPSLFFKTSRDNLRYTTVPGDKKCSWIYHVLKYTIKLLTARNVFYIFKNIITKCWWRMHINICPLTLNYNFLNY